ncbi:MAG TPA: GAF domain-containing protein [Geobacteraceae bacterium]|nr:GAF domain-containing protein [Geobacteraceae bacterium]
MATDKRTRAELLAEIEDLRMSLAENCEMQHAPQSGRGRALIRPVLPEQILHKKNGDADIFRNRFSDLYDFAPLGYVTLDGEGVIRAINLTGARLLGTPRAALIGVPFSSHLREEEGQALLDHLRQCGRSDEQVVTELCIVAKDGSEIRAQLSTVQTRNDEGVNFYHSAITDITELKKTEESLLRLNRLYAVLSETGKTIIHAADRETLFSEICRVAVEHGGFLLAWIGLVDEQSRLVRPVASAGMTGYLDDINISVDDEETGRGPTGRAISNGTYHISNNFQNDRDTLPWRTRSLACGIKSSTSVALKQNGVTIGALTIYAGEKDFFRWQFTNLLQQMAADISFALDSIEREAQRRKAELSLRAETAERLRAVEELREKDRLLLQQSRQAAMGEMIGNIAHQWRQPLNALGLCIQELGLTFELGSVTGEHLEKSIKQAMDIIFGMSQTIDDFRNLYKADTERRWFRINQAVARTVSLIEANFHEHRIAIDVVTDGDPEIKGYHNDYAQVLLNILINARDTLMERGTASPRVTVRTGVENGRSVVTVGDNASGIDEEILDKVFDLYFTTKENGLGTGIGLFMAKTLIEKNMGGRLTVRNLGDGAEFRIEV